LTGVWTARAIVLIGASITRAIALTVAWTVGATALISARTGETSAAIVDS